MTWRCVLVLSLSLALLAGCSCGSSPDPNADDAGCRTDLDCDDGVACTQDFCRASGGCVRVGDHTLCDGGQLCEPPLGCVPRDTCVADVDCEDGDVCNGRERCDEQICTPGELLSCDDGVFCNGTETCDPQAGCRVGAVPDCSDGIDCTADSCDPAADACASTPADPACDDGEFCNGRERCTREQGCVAGEPPCADSFECTEDSCIEDGARCLPHAIHERCADDELCIPDGLGDECRRVPCIDDASCDDLDPCNGVETCGAEGICTPSGAIHCDDAVLCNGREYCDEAGLCQAQEATSCVDGVDCTVDSCDIGIDACVHVPSHLACADAEVCNGTEICGVLGCAAGPPLDCDDENACTEDACDEPGGGCVTTPRDRDGDGQGDVACGGTDCDDLDSFVSPDEEEICNDVDDDCDLVVDEGFSCRRGASSECTTACGSSGTRACLATCDWDACVPPAEDCNAVDDDCDGAVDEGCDCELGDPTECPTPCGSSGSRQCVGGHWSPCQPPVESCNGLDDDCVGGADDGFACARGTTRACATGCGSTGVQTCTDACSWGTCLPPTEACNGRDDNCDAACDETFSCCAGTPGTCNTVCGSTGIRICGLACTWSLCQPPDEVCNGIDDDCNGVCDDEEVCCASTPVGCVSTCNSLSSATCTNACSPPLLCPPPAEVCNGRDDDCDGVCDDSVGECCALTGLETCTILGTMQGRRSCSLACAWSACCAASERCANGADDDCDGSTDELGCCSEAGGGDPCNGQDDDCDGLCDEDQACCRFTMESCRTKCNTVGARFCDDSCLWDACVPPPEDCVNGIDDDCDENVDSEDRDC